MYEGEIDKNVNYHYTPYLQIFTFPIMTAQEKRVKMKCTYAMGITVTIVLQNILV